MSRPPMFKRRTKPKQEECCGTVSSASQLRIQRDLAEFDIPQAKIDRKPDEWHEFVMEIIPDVGYWKGKSFSFLFQFPSHFPFHGPTVRCQTPIYHPNIDTEGKICLNILRPWKPFYTINFIGFGLLFLFSDPNPNDPLHVEAANLLRNNPIAFAKKVSY
jgi:ubiquitin-conjugating enzyme E2 M